MAKFKKVKQSVSGSFDEGNSSKESQTDVKLKISSKNIAVICEKLEELLNFFFKDTNYLNFINDYPVFLEKKFLNSTQELECMLKELKRVQINLQKQKLQQKCIEMEKKCVKETLKKLKDTEIREMETIVSVFDPVMFSRWESIKSTRKLETLEGFLSDIKSKQLALENLNTLVTRKVKNTKTILLNKNNDNNKDSSVVLPILEINSTESTIPPPPPLPVIPYYTHSQVSTRQRQRIENLRRYELFHV
ncbi:uncharacterized protein LOC141527341 [Cotesia typhae]